jgi:phytoene dehydrogenase-like protein
MTYDLIIAGGGLGGLVCAATLAKEGFRVCVLEKNPVLGGCLQDIRRKGVMLDTGYHYVGCLDEGQVLHQYFSYLGIMNKLKLHRLDDEAFDIVNIAGKEYRHAMGHERFIETLATDFPKEKENIRQMVAQFKTIGDLINPDVLRSGRFSQNGLPYFSTSAEAFLKESTSNADLRNAIAGTSILSGGECETMSLYIFGMILNSNIESSYRFRNSSQQVADLLAEEIRKHGGEVRTNAEVTRFVVDGDRVSAVEINGEELLYGKNFISNIHPARTFELTDKCSAFKRAYLARINSLPVSMGFLSVSLVFEPNSFPYLNRNYYYHDEGDVWFDRQYNFREKKKFFLSFSPPENGSRFASAAHILEPMYWHEVAEWADTKVEKRGNAYKEFKQRRTEQLIDYLNQRHPELKNSIAAYYTSTPLTFRDYTATKEGSAYGNVKDFHHPELSLLPAKTRLSNLFLTGQNNNVHGMIGVMMTAMYTCAEFVEMDYLARKIGNN